MTGKIKICIDTGHGGGDPGAVGIRGAQEKRANKNVADKLKEYLLKQGFEVVMTRPNDETVSLAERCRIANASGADLLVSVHHNAGGGDGYEIIYSIHGGKGKELAALIAEEFSRIGQNKRRVYSKESEKHPGTDYYAMIRDTKMPAVITEFGFIDSKDFDAFDTLTEQWKEAAAIAKAICRLYKVEWRE